MHIVIANNIYPPHAAGGAELIVSYLATEVARRGHQVTVLSTCGRDMEPYPDEMADGVRIVRFFPSNLYWSFDRQPRPAWKKGLWHLRDAWNIDAARRMRKLLVDDPPAVLHTHVIDGFSASIWRMARRMGAGVMHTAHDYHLICPRAFMLTRDWKLCVHPTVACRAYAQWHLRSTNYVDLFTSPSQFLIDQHLKKGLQFPRHLVVSNGVTLPATAARQSSIVVTTEPLRLLLAARLTVEKGIRVALEAMRQLPPDVNVTLDIAGRGPLEGEVRAAEDLDPRIRFHGYVSGEDKTRLFAVSDVLLLPSLWYENAPVVIVEAGVYGMGVIASDIGAIPEFVTTGENGLLFASTTRRPSPRRSGAWLRTGRCSPASASTASVSRVASPWAKWPIVTSSNTSASRICIAHLRVVARTPRCGLVTA